MPRLVSPAALALLVSLTACAPSVQQEIAIGNQYNAQLERQLPLVTDPTALRYFRQAVAPLEGVAHRQDLAWDFHIVNSSEINAFALPGGHLYVNRGLIESARRYDEFAAAVGHEIGHVDLRHSAKQMGQANAANIGLGVAYAAMGRSPGAVEQAAVGLAGGAVFAKFSRDDEREADSASVGYLTRAKINPGGLPRLLETLERLQRQEPSAVQQWFSSHPMPAERVGNAERIIQNDRAASRAVETGRRRLDAFQRLQARLRALPPAPKETRTQ